VIWPLLVGPIPEGAVRPSGQGVCLLQEVLRRGRQLRVAAAPLEALGEGHDLIGIRRHIELHLEPLACRQIDPQARADLAIDRVDPQCRHLLDKPPVDE